MTQRWDVVDDSGNVLDTVEAENRTDAEWMALAVPAAHNAIGVGVRPARTETADD